MDPFPALPDHQAGRGGGVGLRLFAALGMPHEPARAIADYADALASRVPSARAADAASIHLTWAFLGDVSEDHVPAVASAFEAAAFAVPGPTECAVTGAVAFGEGRVLALDIDVDLLVVLDGARDRSLGAIAPYAPDVDRRAWRPHVAVLRSGSDSRLPTAMLAAAATLRRCAGSRRSCDCTRRCRARWDTSTDCCMRCPSAHRRAAPDPARCT